MADVYYGSLFGLFFVILVGHEDFLLSVARAELHPATDFSRHTLVKPRIYHGREKRQISTTKQEDGKHAHHLNINYDIDGKDYVLDLQLNRDLIPKGYFKRFQKDGEHVVNKPNEEEVELCHYQGKIRGVSDSWAAISTCKDEGGLSGVIFDGKEMHYLEKNSNSDPEDPHYLYKHSDLVDNNKTCGYKGAHDHKITENHEFNRILRYKRAAEPTGLIKGPYNADRTSKYVELVLVVDNTEYKEMGENMGRVEHHCKTIANIINGLYAPLNIFIALVGIVIWTERDEVNFSPNGDITLSNFLHYRREKLIKDHPNDNAQLLTKFAFEHGVVGKALKGPICTIEYSGGVNTDHSPIVGLVATTVAHEMGHNFGMEHDTNECQCPEERCIMAPSSSVAPPAHWSSCSLEYLIVAFSRGMDYCLRNKPLALFDSPVCGNGFVEPGEQCDCGLPDHCNNTCCNATTCMLYSNATCATGECCDLDMCRPKSASTVCRSAELECDLPEYCTGQSEYCPADIYKMDTEVCDGGKAYCYKGLCRTRSDQCKRLWGPTGKSSDDQCYYLNTKGTRHGNCGYYKLSQTFYKCKDEDVFCGMLHCKHLNERLEFGMESVAILSHTFINVDGSVVPCRTALVDLGINQIDPGLVPDGAECGKGKMCVNQKCVSVAKLRETGRTCPNNCNGNGYCNNLGHCHCKDGFAPPLCEYPGFGGSEDSGPTNDPDARKDFVTAMFIIFLGIIPVLAIIGFLMYYTKHNLSLTWKKSSPAKKSPSKPRGLTPFHQQSNQPKRTEDNHSLLQQQELPPPSGFKTEFFGHFKGFSLTPVKNCEPEPVKFAPPVLVPPAIPIMKTPSVTRSNTVASAKANFLNNIINTNKPPTNATNSVIPPALPPLNPGSHPRPIISSPILENSTCTAKELMSPLRNAPKIPFRQAPPAPNNHLLLQRPLSSPDTIIVATIIPEEEKKPPHKESNSALNRIASFLKSDKHNSNSLPKTTTTHSVKASKVLHKNSLRTIEISNPIPQTDINLPTPSIPVESSEIASINKPVVMRAQSMRGGNVTQRPNIPNFGSMRNPNGFKRPVSIPAAHRPKSPPPPRPPPVPAELQKETVKVPALPGYQKPGGGKPAKQPSNHQYDDCLNEAKNLNKIKEENSPINDNIYAVIDESPVTAGNMDGVKSSSSGSSESVGLLGEIVSEIQNRNVDSIYSTSTLARKKKEQEEMEAAKALKGGDPDSTETYVNTSSMYKVPESIYSNMNNAKSSASSTSSGYINPSLVNPPPDPTPTPKPAVEVIKPQPATAKPTLSTFKTDSNTYKPYSSALQRGPGPFASSFNSKRSQSPSEPAKNATNKTTPPSPTNKTPSKALNRQITPPNLRTRKPSPTRTAPASPKNTAATPKLPKSTSNSPDLVTSCSNNNSGLMENNAKAPDVLNNSYSGGGGGGGNSSSSSNSSSSGAASILKKPNPPKSVPTNNNNNNNNNNNKINKSSVSLKSPADKKKSLIMNGDAVKPPVSAKLAVNNKSITPGTKVAARQNSNVAALQQKFEHKPPISAKTVTVPTKK